MSATEPTTPTGCTDLPWSTNQVVHLHHRAAYESPWSRNDDRKSGSIKTLMIHSSSWGCARGLAISISQLIGLDDHLIRSDDISRLKYWKFKNHRAKGQTALWRILTLAPNEYYFASFHVNYRTSGSNGLHWSTIELGMSHHGVGMMTGSLDPSKLWWSTTPREDVHVVWQSQLVD